MNMKRLLSILTASALAAALTLPAWASETVDTAIAPSGMTMVRDTLYVADTYHRAIWTVEDGEVSLLAGRTEVTDLSGQPVEGYNDGTFDQAAFSEPWAIVPYSDGFLVSDTGNHVLRYLNMDKGKVYTAAGTGKAGFRNNTGEKAAFHSPTGLAVDDEGTVYIADTGNNVIRCMDEDGKVITYAGGKEGCALGSLKEVQFSAPTGLCWADGVLYVADTGNHRIVAIADGEASLMAGAELTGDAAVEGDYRIGRAEIACFASPQGVAVGDDGTVYVADTGNGAIRMIQNGFVSTILGMDSTAAYPASPRGLWVDGDTLYVGDMFSRVLLTTDIAGDKITFDDVAEGSWYYDAVRFVTTNGLLNGTQAATFTPDATVSRQQVWMILARLSGPDPKDMAAARAWVMANGISDGSAPGGAVTRQQLASMLYRYAVQNGYDVSVGENTNILSYTDFADLSEYAIPAMQWACGAGMISGTGDGSTLSPQGTATRAQLAVMLYRWLA